MLFYRLTDGLQRCKLTRNHHHVSIIIVKHQFACRTGARVSFINFGSKWLLYFMIDRKIWLLYFLIDRKIYIQCYAAHSASHRTKIHSNLGINLKTGRSMQSPKISPMRPRSCNQSFPNTPLLYLVLQRSSCSSCMMGVAKLYGAYRRGVNVLNVEKIFIQYRRCSRFLSPFNSPHSRKTAPSTPSLLDCNIRER